MTQRKSTSPSSGRSLVRKGLIDAEAPTFPKYGDVPAKPALDNLVRLLNAGLFDTEYIDAKSAAGLVAAGMKSYRAIHNDPRWAASPILSRVV